MLFFYFLKGAATTVGGIVAEGYAIGEGIKSAVVDADNAIGFSAGVKKTATDIDQALGLSTKATVATTYVNQKMVEFDNALGLSTAARSAGASIQEAATNVAKNPAVNSTLSVFRAWGNSLSRTYSLFRNESAAAIQAKKEEIAAAEPQMSNVGEESEGDIKKEDGEKKETSAATEVKEEEEKPTLPPKPLADN